MALHTDAKRVKAEDASLESLIRTLHFDLCNVAEMAGTLETFRAVSAEVLLMGGTRSAPYLRSALDVLNDALAHARRVSLSGLGHLAADDVGQPEPVVSELRPFFAGTTL